MPHVVGQTSALLAFDSLGSSVSCLLDIFCCIEESSGKVLDYFSMGDFNKRISRQRPRHGDRQDPQRASLRLTEPVLVLNPQNTNKPTSYTTVVLSEMLSVSGVASWYGYKYTSYCKLQLL